MHGPDNFVIGGISPILPATFGDDTDIYFTTGDNNNILFAKLSTAGELLWYRYIGGGGTGASYFGYDLTQTADGNFVISGDASSAPSNTIDGRTAILPYGVGDDRNALALKIDPEGNLLWFTYLGGGSGAYRLNDISRSTDGRFVIAGTIQNGSSTMAGISAVAPDLPSVNSAFLTKLTPSGSLEWFTYASGGPGSYYGMASVTGAVGGGLIAVGLARNGAPTIQGRTPLNPFNIGDTYNLFLLKLDGQGRL